jgi:hypothetical protein
LAVKAVAVVTAVEDEPPVDGVAFEDPSDEDDEQAARPTAANASGAAHLTIRFMR